MYVLIGNYGSGKTELALNFAIRAAADGDRTELLDLDMVNTYFRLTEPGRLMRMKDIRVVSPNFTNSSVETLSLPAEVQSAFAMDWDTVVFDVGGDAVGSTALGRYHQDFEALEPGDLQVLNVVNIRRPLSGTVEKIIRLQEEMEAHSRLKITGMINNTNLADETTPDMVKQGEETVLTCAEALGGIPEIEIVLVGGCFRVSNLDFCGAVAVDTFRQFYCDMAFVGCDAFLPGHGAFSFDAESAAVSKAIRRSAAQLVLLCDNRKIGSSGAFLTFSPREIDRIVTDRADERLTRAGFDVLVAR